MKISSNQTLTLQINSLSHDGRGIAHLDGKTTFISGALPGETVVCEIHKKHSRYNEGKVVEVIQASPQRVEPGCAHFTVCGGCSLQHLDMQGQLQFKQQVLLEQLKHFGEVTPEHILPAIDSAPWGYRRKARLGVRYVRKKERVLIGFREKFSRYLADIHHCPILNRIGDQLDAYAALISSLSQYEHIPQIEVAIGDTDIALIFRHMTDLPPEDREKLRCFAEKNQIHLYLQPNAPAVIEKLWPRHCADRLSYAIPEYQLTMQFHPSDFTQINNEVNQKMIKQALDLLSPQKNEQVLDLFCGLGNFTLPIATVAHSVTGIEGSAALIERAKENATLNQLNNATFYAANLTQIDEKAPWLQKKYDKILLDPPRTGAKEMLSFIPRLSANRLVYVSCNPATLARDAKELVHLYGYQLKQIGIMNMFPHTSHIEAIALFEK